MVSFHTIHAQNSSNILLAMISHKTNKYCSLAYPPIFHGSHKPHLASGGIRFMLHCMCIPTRQACPTPQMLCYVFSQHQSQVAVVQQFLHILLAHAFIQSQCPYCAHPCKKGILHVKFGLWMPHLVLSSITDAFHTIKKTFVLIVLVFQLSSCTFIQESPWHTNVTILWHS